MNIDGSFIGNRKVVLKALVGSHNYNLNTPTSDRDWKYFVLPTFDDLYTGKMFATAKQGETDDFDCHDVRQLANLLWKANIAYIEVLHSVDVGYDPALKWLFENREALSTMNLPYFFNSTLGMHLEKMKTLDKGTAKTDVLVEQYGYDTKQACHALRCLFVLERVSWGLPMGRAIYFGDGTAMRQLLLNVKAGYYTREKFLEMVLNWRVEKLDDVKAWFTSQQDNPTLKDELDNLVKEFIRTRLK